MHNNSSICTINPRIPRQQTNKQKKVFLWRHDDVITSLFIFSSSWAQLGSREEKKNSAQNFTHFSSKIHRFPSSNINFSIQTQKIAQKTHNSKNQTSPNFRNIIKWAPKITKFDGFCSKQYSLQVSNLNRAWKRRINTKRKKTPKNVFHNQKTRNKKLT